RAGHGQDPSSPRGVDRGPSPHRGGGRDTGNGERALLWERRSRRGDGRRFGGRRSGQRSLPGRFDGVLTPAALGLRSVQSFFGLVISPPAVPAARAFMPTASHPWAPSALSAATEAETPRACDGASKVG